MRIAVFHELHAGGARRAVNELASRLKKRNTVDLYSTLPDLTVVEKENFSSAYVFDFKETPWKGRDWKARLYKDTVELLRLFYHQRRIAREIDKQGYELVFVHPSQFTQAPFLLSFLRTTSVYYCQEPLRVSYEPDLVQEKMRDPVRGTYQSFTNSLKRSIDMVNTKRAGKVIANSRFTKNNIQKVYGITSDVCYLGVDHRKFTKKTTKKKNDILFIGSKSDVDGYSLLQKALTLMRKKPQLCTVLSEKEWKLSDKELVDIYNSTKITLCLAVNEPFGLIPLESMACGVPVIAVNQGGYRETVKNGETGILVERDPKKIADAIDDMLKDPKKVRSYGDNGRKRIEKNWTWEKSTQRIEALFRTIV